MKRTLLLGGFLILGGAHLGMSLLLDLMVIPTVFRTLPDIFLSGRIGIKLFPAFNGLEVILTGASLGLLMIGRGPGLRFLRLLTVALFLLSLVYFFYLSPKIVWWTGEMERLKEGAIELFVVAQNEHSFYHTLYRKLEVIKLGLLFVSLGWGLGKLKSMEEKAS